jgi:hypothetical protein
MSKRPLKIYTNKDLVTALKAGVMLYEDTPEGRKLLVPYNEGRFAKDGLYLGLAKGSVDYDKGESTLRGGLRECGEETGFHLIDQPDKHIEGYFSEAQIQALERGEVLEHITNPRFPGFEIVHFNPKAYMHEYHARSGDTHWVAMYGVEVKGLDSLAPHLKNAEGKVTRDFLDANKDIPRFSSFLKWMREGFIPADGDLQFVKLEDAGWFAAKEKQYIPTGIEVPGSIKPDWQATRKQWQKFCQAMEKDKDYPKLRTCLHAIKERMQASGFVQGDNAVLKFDEKDCPLFWYTEGVYTDAEGKIPYARPIITKVFNDMNANTDYARAFGGHATKASLFNLHEIMQLGQVAAFSPFVSQKDWRGACLDAGIAGRVAQSLIRTGRRMTHRADTTPSQVRA